jgi:hypothetical protein
MTTAPTTDDLRAAYNRCPLLRLAGYTFARAINTELVRRGLELSARAHAKQPGQPVQAKLI